MKYLVLFLLILAACSAPPISQDITALSNKTAREWQQDLAPEVYHILWEKGTERPFTSELLYNKEEGIYYTAGCKIPVFSSEQKYESGTGWPSFYDTPFKENLVFEEDYKLGYKRIEILSTCGEHLGHVFEDGPQPTGLRYCINELALEFEVAP